MDRWIDNRQTDRKKNRKKEREEKVNRPTGDVGEECRAVVLN